MDEDLNKMQQEPQQTVQENSMQELARMEREKRRFTILQRERAMNDAQRAKNRSAILAGVCILGAAVAVYFNGQDINQVLQHELNAIYSWEALGQYLQDIGPMTTILAAGAGTFFAKYLKNSRKFKKAQQEFVDFNASLENAEEQEVMHANNGPAGPKINPNELGGSDSVKSR